jgi:hypothetical protein
MHMNMQIIEERLPTPVSAEPEAVPSELLAFQLQRRLGSRVRDLRVLVRHDGMILKGWTCTYHAKQLAQHAAMDLADMRIVANEIEVR